MKVLIFNGSPRPKGNTKQMIQAFCEGLETAGHEYGVYEVCKMNIHGCLACEYCHTKGNGQCVQKDDMQFVYHELQEAEMLVIASPIYYHGLSGQPDMYDGALFSYKGDFLDYLQLEDMGVFTTHGYDPGVSEEKLEELRRFGASLR